MELRKGKTITGPSPTSVFEHRLPMAKSKPIARKELVNIRVKVSRVEFFERLHKNGINTVPLDQHNNVNLKNMEEESKSKPKDTNTDFENPTIFSDRLQNNTRASKNWNNISAETSGEEINAKDVDLEVNMTSVNKDVPWVSFSSGDIFWGQLYSFCNWPCMVCPDPDSNTITTDVVGGRNIVPHVMVHVRFFADNALRNWVKRDNLFPFTGIENYKQKMLEAEEKYGKKNPRYKAFLVSRGKQRLWNLAIEEANIIKTTSREKRLDKYIEIYENSKLISKLERKRRQSLYIKLESKSDISSLYDTSDNLSSKQTSTGLKREHSISPFSPGFSPVGPKTTKRRKLGQEEETTTSLNSNINYQRNFLEEDMSAMETPLSQFSLISTYSQQDEEIFDSNEFQIFFKAMKKFVMKHNNDEKLERSVVVAIRNIWALKHINSRQMQERSLQTPGETDLGSIVVDGVGTCGSFKRLSNRLRSRTLNCSLSKMNTPPITLTQSKPIVSLR